METTDTLLLLLRERTPEGVARALASWAPGRVGALDAELWAAHADGTLSRVGDADSPRAPRAALGLELLPAFGEAPRAPGAMRGRRAFAALPLEAGDALVGVLLLGFAPGTPPAALSACTADAELGARLALAACALERLELRAAMQRAQHDAIARVGAGLAHTLGNVLQAALSAVEHARVAPPGEARNSLLEAASALKRASAVTTQLAALGGTRGDPQPTEVTGLVAGLAAALEPYMPPGVKIGVERAAGTEVWSEIDAVAVEAALAGLIHTAREQVGAAGLILVAVRAVTGPAGQRLCEVEVRCSGVESPIGERVTLPVASASPLPANDGGDTHGAGRLGLDMARAALARYQGTIEARGEGVERITAIRLPVTLARTAVSSSQVAALRQSELGIAAIGPGAPPTFTVLVADDEPAVLRGVRRVLTAGGHRVRAARDGAEALALARSQPDIDVALVDLTMPNLAGPPLVAALRTTLPRAPVVVMTGYASDEMVAALRAAGAAMVLKKPIAAARLVEALAQAVDREREPSDPHAPA